MDQPTMPMSDPRYKEAAKRFWLVPYPDFYIPATDDHITVCRMSHCLAAVLCAT